MTDSEKIPVFIRIVHGKTICVCHADRKGCSRNCERDVVSRDKFRGWQAAMRRNRYGQ